GIINFSSGSPLVDRFFGAPLPRGAGAPPEGVPARGASRLGAVMVPYSEPSPAPKTATAAARSGHARLPRRPGGQRSRALDGRAQLMGSEQKVRSAGSAPDPKTGGINAGFFLGRQKFLE